MLCPNQWLNRLGQVNNVLKALRMMERHFCSILQYCSGFSFRATPRLNASPACGRCRPLSLPDKEIYGWHRV